jgi:predicted amidohydrolase
VAVILGAVQFFATPFNFNRNLETAGRLARHAAAQGAQVIVLPELFNTGYVYARRLLAAAEDANGPTLAWLADLSAELGACVGGTLLLLEGAHLYNTFALACPGGQTHNYRKQHPFVWERCLFEAGPEPLVAQTPFGRLGLMVCWDIAHRAVWEAYRGRVDGVLIASSPPRLHRAVLNFPLGRKVYLAQMAPGLLRARDEIDGWYQDIPASGAAWLGVPVVHAVMAGRFVTEVPLARLSFLAASLPRPRYWPLAGQARLASLRATFYACSAIFNNKGEALARVESEEGVAVADVSMPEAAAARQKDNGAAQFSLPTLPLQVRALDWMLRPLAPLWRRGYL